jgi:hypothetical protein
MPKAKRAGDMAQVVEHLPTTQVLEKKKKSQYWKKKKAHKGLDSTEF